MISHLHTHQAASNGRTCFKCGEDLREGTVLPDKAVFFQGQSVVKIITQYGGVVCYAAGQNNQQPPCRKSA